MNIGSVCSRNILMAFVWKLLCADFVVSCRGPTLWRISEPLQFEAVEVIMCICFEGFGADFETER